MQVSISIHAPREGSDFLPQQHPYLIGISIHAPREGSDAALEDLPHRGPDFYPRSPRGERPSPPGSCPWYGRFLSTLPARGATTCFSIRSANFSAISIHAPREGSDHLQPVCPDGALPISIHAPREGSDAVDARPANTDPSISIHAPREGSDPGRMAWPPHTAGFLSTLPARGATRAG